MTFLLFGLILGQIDAVESADFSKADQKKAVLATVRVANPAQRKVGSGVIVGRTGAYVYVLTAAHILADNRGLEISAYSEMDYPKPLAVYRETRVLATTSDRADLAIVRFAAEEKTLGQARLCPPSARPKKDQFPVLSVGCQKGEAPTFAIDRVAGVKKAGDVAFWECTQPPAQGRSGGPLIDARGYVVGINSGTAGGKAYSTHIDEVHRFLRKNALQWLADEDE